MGLLNMWIGQMMADADREDARKKQEQLAIQQAQGRADYATQLLGADQGWQTWSPDGSLGAPSGYPAALGKVPDTNAWRFAPDEAARTVQGIRDYQLRPTIAQQTNAIAHDQFINNYPVGAAIPAEEAWRTTSAYGSVPARKDAEVAFGAIKSGVLPSIGSTAANTQNVQANTQLAQAKEEERLKMGQQRAQLEATRNAAAIPGYRIQQIGDEAVLNDPKAIAELAINRNKLEGSNIATTIADNAERGKLRPYKTQYELSNMARQQKENQVAGITQDELLANPQLLRDVATKGLQRQLTIDTYGSWPDERQKKFFTLNKDGTFSVKDNSDYDDPLKAILGNADPLNNAASSVSSIKPPAKPVMTSRGFSNGMIVPMGAPTAAAPIRAPIGANVTVPAPSIPTVPASINIAGRPNMVLPEQGSLSFLRGMTPLQQAVVPIPAPAKAPVVPVVPTQQGRTAFGGPPITSIEFWNALADAITPKYTKEIDRLYDYPEQKRPKASYNRSPARP